MMDLAICIVSHNSAGHLPRCLESLRVHAPAGEYEVVVVDNDSTDGTPDLVAERFPWVRLVRNLANPGFAAANNQAVALTSAPLVLLLNPDTEVSAGALQVMLSFITAHPNAGAAGPKLVYPDGKLQMSCHDRPDLLTALYGALGLAQALPRSRTFGRYDMTWWSHAEARAVGWVSGAALLVRREVWDDVGPLDERFFMYWEDADWQVRMHRAGHDCWYLPAARVIHHEAASWGAGPGLTRRILTAHRAAFVLCRKHYGLGGELVLRLLTAVGALGRAVAWLPAWLLRGLGQRDAARLTLHLRVMAVALGLAHGPIAPR